ncbi:MAG TPA: hypothetical protein VMU37_04105, partial [Caulobacteraceae bacterium]|nr:hypothetical protein [Caulobacteraceae bacterium]
LYQDDQHGPVPAESTPRAWAPYLRASFADAADPVRRILGDLDDSAEIYQDRIRRIPPQKAAVGRVALLGDAGYCPTFFSGNGSALATLGGYVLARRLGESDDDAEALADYERRILPLAAAYQASAESMRERIFTRSPLKLAVRNAAMKYTPDWLMAKGLRRHYHGEVQLADVA